MKTLRLLLAVLLVLSAPSGAWAYSYAAAGKEPLIDGREAVLAAVNAGDWVKAGKELAVIKADLTYLTEHHDAGLLKALDEAVAAKDKAAVATGLRRAFADEIERRLDGAAQNINDYQAAKVLVVKSKRFFDAMAGELPPDNRAKAEAALGQTLAAIGNPGVFGAGRRPADPAAFDVARKAALAALGR